MASLQNRGAGLAVALSPPGAPAVELRAQIAIQSTSLRLDHALEPIIPVLDATPGKLTSCYLQQIKKSLDNGTYLRSNAQ
jgi:hypothetical protein